MRHWGQRVVIYSHLQDGGGVLRPEALVENISQVDQAHTLRFSVDAEVESSPQTLDTLKWISLHPPIERCQVVRSPAGLLFLQHFRHAVAVLGKPLNKNMTEFFIESVHNTPNSAIFQEQ